MFCKNCEKQISENSNFCTNCGIATKKAKSFWNKRIIGVIGIICLIILLAVLLSKNTAKNILYKQGRLLTRNETLALTSLQHLATPPEPVNTNYQSPEMDNYSRVYNYSGLTMKELMEDNLYFNLYRLFKGIEKTFGTQQIIPETIYHLFGTNEGGQSIRTLYNEYCKDPITFVKHNPIYPRFYTFENKKEQEEFRETLFRLYSSVESAFPYVENHLSPSERAGILIKEYLKLTKDEIIRMSFQDLLTKFLTCLHDIVIQLPTPHEELGIKSYEGLIYFIFGNNALGYGIKMQYRDKYEFGSIPDSTEDAKTLYEKGLKELGKEYYSVAFEKFYIAKKKGMDTAELRREIAVCLWQFGERPYAVAELQTAIKKFPQDSKLHHTLSQSFNKMGIPELSIDELNKAIILNPQEPSFHSLLSLYLFEIGKYQEALEEGKKALELGHKNPALVHLNLGVTYNRLERYEECVKEYQNALKVNPNYEPAKANLKSALEILKSKQQVEKILLNLKAVSNLEKRISIFINSTKNISNDSKNMLVKMMVKSGDKSFGLLTLKLFQEGYISISSGISALKYFGMEKDIVPTLIKKVKSKYLSCINSEEANALAETGDPEAIAFLQEIVDNQGWGFYYAQDALERYKNSQKQLK